MGKEIIDALKLQQDILKRCYENNNCKRTNEVLYCALTKDGKNYYIGDNHFAYVVPKKQCGISFDNFSAKADGSSVDFILDRIGDTEPVEYEKLYKNMKYSKLNARKFVNKDFNFSIMVNDKFLKYLNIEKCIFKMSIFTEESKFENEKWTTNYNSLLVYNKENNNLVALIMPLSGLYCLHTGKCYSTIRKIGDDEITMENECKWNFEEVYELISE